jgi:general secretion pathway protein K
MKSLPSGEKGVALLSVLALIATMSVAALIALDALTRIVVLSKTASGRSQAAWYMASAEAMATSVLDEAISATDGKLGDAAAAMGAPMMINLPGGSIRVITSDASNCFNLNSIAVKSEGRGYGIDETAAERMKTLLQEADASGIDAHALVDTLADWIDQDATPSARGAEDGYYISLNPPYRTAGTLLSSTAELRAVAGFNSDVRRSLAPLVCVRPTSSESVLNINTLSTDEAALLTAKFSPALDAVTARRLIEQRPGGGWVDVEDFLAEDAVKIINPLERRDQVLSVTSSYFELSGEIQTGNEKLPFELLMVVEAKASVRVVSRRFGGD